MAQETESWGFVAQNREISDLLVKDRNDEPLTEAEQLRLSAYWMKSLLGSQWNYQETPESTEWVSGERRVFAAYPSLRSTWQGDGDGARGAGKDNFDSGFVEFYEASVVNQP